MIMSNVAATICIILGFIAIISPSAIENFVGISANGLEGKSEVRATYGGFFIGIAMYALYTQSAEAFLTIGIGWLGAALIRTATLMTGSYSFKNLGAVFFEFLIGILCMVNFIQGG